LVTALSQPLPVNEIALNDVLPRSAHDVFCPSHDQILHCIGDEDCSHCRVAKLLCGGVQIQAGDGSVRFVDKKSHVEKRMSILCESTILATLSR